jgi:hypothetical protein
MTEEKTGREEGDPLINELFRLQHEYKKRFGDVLMVGPWGFTVEEAVKI